MIWERLRSASRRRKEARAQRTRRGQITVPWSTRWRKRGSYSLARSRADQRRYQLRVPTRKDQREIRWKGGRRFAARQLTKATSRNDKPRVLVDVVREERSDVQGVASSANTEGKPSTETVAEGAREERRGGKGRVLRGNKLKVNSRCSGLLAIGQTHQSYGAIVGSLGIDLSPSSDAATQSYSQSII